MHSLQSFYPDTVTHIYSGITSFILIRVKGILENIPDGEYLWKPQCVILAILRFSQEDWDLKPVGFQSQVMTVIT